MYVKAELVMSHPDNRVEYDLFYSTVLDIDRGMLFDLGSHERAFESQALFTPRIITYQCDNCSEKEKRENCLSNGRYCAYPPKNDPNPDLGIASGMNLLLESLRSKCVYDYLRDQKGEDQDFFTWYNYMINFDQDCENHAHFTYECANV